jgi:16S rRNA (guanine527-N7)-methyltransferase
MDKLIHEFYELSGITLTPHQIATLTVFMNELALWNSRQNLTAIQEPEQVRVKHFLDSLSGYLVMKGTLVSKVIDVGTGAGFPGIPLKVLCPAINLTLVESKSKKADFCRHVVKEMELDGVEVIQSRAELIGHKTEHRETYDWALARAVAVLPVLLEYLLPLVKIGGCVLAMKGGSAPAEIQSSERAIQLLGGHLRQLLTVTLPGVVEERYLIVVDKIAATPEKYPRRVGIPSKRPL